MLDRSDSERRQSGSRCTDRHSHRIPRALPLLFLQTSASDGRQFPVGTGETAKQTVLIDVDATVGPDTMLPGGLGAG